MNEFRLMISIISLIVTIDSYLDIFLWLKYVAARFNLQHRQIMDYGMSYNCNEFVVHHQNNDNQNALFFLAQMNMSSLAAIYAKHIKMPASVPNKNKRGMFKCSAKINKNK